MKRTLSRLRIDAVLSGRARWIIAACAMAAAHTLYGEVRDNAAFVGFQLLEEPTNPVAIGMGTAGTALRTTATDAMSRGFASYNPALPVLAAKPSLTVEGGQYQAGDLNRAHFETTWPFASWFAGASIHTEAIDDIVRTSIDGTINENATFSSQLTHIALDIGLIRGNVFGLGLCLNGIQERIAEYRAYALTLSAGVVYDLIPGKLAVGASGFHLGLTTSMLDTTLDWGEGARLPKTARAGISWTDTLKTIGYSAAADIVFRNADMRIMVPVGLEVRPFEQVALRVGKRFNHDTEILNFGFGITIAPLSADASFVIPKLVDDAELKWLVSVTYTLKESPKIGGKKKVTVSDKEAPVVTPAEEPDTAAGDTARQIIEQEPVIDEGHILPEEQPEKPVLDADSIAAVPDSVREAPELIPQPEDSTAENMGGIEDETGQPSALDSVQVPGPGDRQAGDSPETEAEGGEIPGEQPPQGSTEQTDPGQHPDSSVEQKTGR